MGLSCNYDTQGIFQLRIKLEKLEEQARAINNALKRCYCYEKFRELNIINHKIEVTNSRIDGSFNHAVESVSLNQL